MPAAPPLLNAIPIFTGARYTNPEKDVISRGFGVGADPAGRNVETTWPTCRLERVNGGGAGGVSDESVSL
jgi:hypothetical protein